jgi:hypothetical protein
MDYRDLGFDVNLLRGESSGSLYPLPEGSTIGSAVISQGLTDPLNTPIIPAQIGSGEYNQLFNVGREGAIFGGATGYLEGLGFWMGYRIAEKDYGFSLGDPNGTYLSYNTTSNTLTIASGPITSGTIAGMTISATALTATSGGNSTIVSSGSTAFTAGPTGSPTFTVTQAGVLTATGAIISGTITAAAGTIGGFDIGADYIRDAANSFGLTSTVTVGDDVRFWAGAAFADRATAPFRLYESGNAVFTDITLSGSDAILEAADVTRAMWVHCYGANVASGGTNRTTAGTQPASGYSDATIKTILLHNNGTNGTVCWKLYYESAGETPYFLEAVNGSNDSDGGSLAIGTDEWWVDSTSIYKNDSAVTISGTGISGDNAIGHDPTNSYLLVLDSSTTVHRYSGISGTTITYVDEITLDNAVDTNKGFIYDNTNSRYICVDGTVLRRFNSSGTTIDTVTFPEVTSGVVISGICFINDRVYLITGYGHIEFQDDTTRIRHIFDAQFIPTSMTR